MDEWTKIVIDERASIRDVLKVIDSGSARIALVVDGNYKLVGTVTDGDIRRGLLRSLEMHDPVSVISNKKPFSISSSLSKEDKINILKENHILAVPVVDHSQKLVGLLTLSDLMRPSPKKNPVCIMAGGFGLRLGALTNHCPKPMLPVGGIPLLERLILQFSEDGFSEFYLTTHFMPDVIRNYFRDGSQWGVKIKYIHEPCPLGTGGAIGLIAKYLGDEPIIVINGDVLTNISFENLIRHHEKNGNAVTISTKEKEFEISYGVVKENNGNVFELEEKPTYRYKINMGIYVLNKSVVESAIGSKRIDMPSIVERNMALGAKVGCYEDESYWLDIGQPADYEKAQKDAYRLFPKN